MNENTLLAFDTDGVFENTKETSSYVSGPVKVEWVERLKQQGYTIAIVSPSPFYPKNTHGQPLFHIFDTYSSNTMRFKNLENFRDNFIDFNNKTPSLCMYISDNGDWKEAQKAGFIYIDAKMFANGFINEELHLSEQGGGEKSE